MLTWEPKATCGAARRGVLKTDHGSVETPIFMPVGTCGSVKGLTAAQLHDTGSRMILANTYHMLLRPGPEIVRELGGLHSMMAWDGPILTDSGGYQVFSLAHMRKIAGDSVTFRSHIDGRRVELTPENVVDTQHQLGPDVMMQLDICAAADATREQFADAMETSVRWAIQSRDAWDQRGRKSVQGHSQALFAIQQGGIHQDLRRES
ncbi:MAG: tRNA-guanine transglycosylase, partial [Phycisphaerales bacterium]|nr:tRNA-guanine transglycosylase [Phycisphaerales bacterium]